MSGYQYIEATGTIVPDTADIQAEVQSEYQAAFGAGLNTAASTRQGVLITAETLTRAEVVANNAALANQINPNISGGVFLEALCALTGFDPPEATPSTIAGVAVTGVASTPIPSGSQAKTAAGDLFETVSLVTLDGSGNGVVDFQSVEDGPVPADINALNEIATDVLGWETVNNATNAAVLGTSALSDQALRALRINTLGVQGQSLPDAMTSALYATQGVTSLQFRENVAATTQTIDGISLIAKSVWACVEGGTDLDVATALQVSKSGGCAYNGAVSVNVVEPASGQTYVVKFDRPTPLAVRAQATVRLPNSSVSQANVTQAILDYAAGLTEGYAGFVVGGSVSPFELAGACVAEIPGLYVQKMEVGLAPSGAYQTTEIALTLAQIATIDATAITVVTI